MWLCQKLKNEYEVTFPRGLIYVKSDQERGSLSPNLFPFFFLNIDRQTRGITLRKILVTQVAFIVSHIFRFRSCQPTKLFVFVRVASSCIICGGKKIMIFFCLAYKTGIAFISLITTPKGANVIGFAQSIIARIISFNTCVISLNHFAPVFLMNKVETIIEGKSIGNSTILLDLSLWATTTFNILINSTKQIISISREEKKWFFIRFNLLIWIWIF